MATIGSNPVFVNPHRGNKLKEGEMVRLFDGGLYFVQYVNSSGAYIVPLTTITREIKGHEIQFTTGGKTISATSIVELVDPLLLGDCPEYRRYVKMAKSVKGKSGKGSGAKVTFDEFDDSDIQESSIAEGQSAAVSVMPDNEKRNDMAKKAAAKANGNGKAKAPAAKREKAPKQVRKCACGCGTDTTGSFAPGHDARMHGWIAKLADGRIQPSDVPAVVRKNLELVQTSSGFKAKAPHFWKA